MELQNQNSSQLSLVRRAEPPEDQPENIQIPKLSVEENEQKNIEGYNLAMQSRCEPQDFVVCLENIKNNFIQKQVDEGKNKDNFEEKNKTELEGIEKNISLHVEHKKENNEKIIRLKQEIEDKKSEKGNKKIISVK